jgi:signal transduction histidine kinase
VDSQDAVVWGDAVQLNRLWLLLIDNAIKYTPLGGTVDVSLRLTPARRPVCEIRDTGIGIPAADLPHIFHRFFRARNAGMQSDVGTGLGLTMAQWITSLHCAQLEVESELGKGSNCRIIFPPPNQRFANTICSTPADVI